MNLIDRKNNEFVSIIKNCIDEVKRDMWYKESQKQGKVFYSEEDLNNDKRLIELMRFDDFKIEDKYELLKSFLGHSFVLQKLKQLIDDEIATRDTDGTRTNRNLKQEIREKQKNFKNRNLFSAQHLGSKGGSRKRSKFLRFKL